jgi:hypothetical protein
MSRHATLHTSHATRHTPHVTRHTPQATGHTPHVTRHTPHVTRHTPHVTRHTPHATRHTSHVTRHTSHATRHTSHATRHTPHATRHTPRQSSRLQRPQHQRRNRGLHRTRHPTTPHSEDVRMCMITGLRLQKITTDTYSSGAKREAQTEVFQGWSTWHAIIRIPDQVLHYFIVGRRGGGEWMYAARMSAGHVDKNTLSDCISACKLGHPNIIPLPNSCCPTAIAKRVFGDGGALPSRFSPSLPPPLAATPEVAMDVPKDSRVRRKTAAGRCVWLQETK